MHAANVWGIHAEGPIVASLGGLPDSTVHVKASLSSFETLLDSIGPALKVMTIRYCLHSGSFSLFLFLSGSPGANSSVCLRL